MKRTSKVSIGSISHATMRPEDLIPRFLSELEHMTGRSREHYNLCRGINARMGSGNYYSSEDPIYDLESLFDALNAYSPKGFYFGSHPGDGSDYGYWLSEEFTEDG